MDIKTLDHLSELSKLNFSEDEKTTYISQMNSIIELMDTIKNFDVVYDDTKDGNEINYNEVREDIACNSFETEKLLANTEPQDNCYVVPKMME